MRFFARGRRRAEDISMMEVDRHRRAACARAPRTHNAAFAGARSARARSKKHLGKCCGSLNHPVSPSPSIYSQGRRWTPLPEEAVTAQHQTYMDSLFCVFRARATTLCCGAAWHAPLALRRIIISGARAREARCGARWRVMIRYQW